MRCGAGGPRDCDAAPVPCPQDFKKGIRAVEWETEMLDYTTGTLEVEYRHLHTLRVTKAMQEFIKGGGEGHNETERAKLLKKIEHVCPRGTDAHSPGAPRSCVQRDVVWVGQKTRGGGGWICMVLHRSCLRSPFIVAIHGHVCVTCPILTGEGNAKCNYLHFVHRIFHSLNVHPRPLPRQKMRNVFLLAELKALGVCLSTRQELRHHRSRGARAGLPGPCGPGHSACPYVMALFCRGVMVSYPGSRPLGSGCLRSRPGQSSTIPQQVQCPVAQRTHPLPPLFAAND